MSNRYVIRPKAASDLDDQAFYLGTRAGTEIAHRFLIAAHETFLRLANQPEMGWHPRVKNPLSDHCGYSECQASRNGSYSIVRALTASIFFALCTGRETFEPLCVPNRSSRSRFIGLG